MWWKVSKVWNFEFLNYVFYVFWKPLQKNVKSRVFWIFKKKCKKRILELWVPIWKHPCDNLYNDKYHSTLVVLDYLSPDVTAPVTFQLVQCYILSFVHILPLCDLVTHGQSGMGRQGTKYYIGHRMSDIIVNNDIIIACYPAITRTVIQSVSFQADAICNAQYIPPTPTRRNCRVASRRRCEHNSQLAHDCRRIRSTIWKLTRLHSGLISLHHFDRYW